MEIVLGLVNCFISFVVGALVTVALQYYIFMKYVRCEPVKDVPKKPASEKYCLPKEVLACLKSCETTDPAMPVAVNLLLQFLFHELRHSSRVRRWFWRKLDMELDELITKSTTGRLFDKLSLRDLHLGSQFPEIKNVQVESVKLDETEGHIDTLDISLDLTYSGNFQLAIDANMVLGKRAYLAVKVRHISGRARLRFTRLPYTHWSFSFHEEPLIELAVESQFQGRQMQSNVTSFISNQIRRAIKRKHTLPNYKIRYKPFFTRTDPGQLEVDENAVVEGLLEVTTLEITRLAVTNPNIEQVYYTMCIDSIPWISLTQRDEQIRILLDVVITKTKTQQLGIVFKQETMDKCNTNVVIETIVPNSPAYDARLYRGDTIISIEGKPVSNTNQVAKIVKSVNMSSFSIRVERKLSDISVHNSTENITVEHFELLDQGTAATKDLISKDNIVLESPDESKTRSKQSSRSVENLTKISFYKTNDCVQIPIAGFGLRKRNCSVDKTSSDSSTGNTPTGSLATTPLRKPTATPERPDRSMSESISANPDVNLKPAIKCFTSGDLPLRTVLSFNNVYTFELCEGDVYLNVNAWGKNPACEGSVLLGYLNVPLATIVNECKDSKLGHYLKCYSLLPPEYIQTNKNNPMSSQPGYEPCLCYGDILLSFLWSSNEQERYQGTSPTHKKQIFKTSQSSVSPEPLVQPTRDGPNRHDFIRTHFHRATQCDFCGKKIWLKDAVQCRECAMCCHKKCVIKCQAASPCASASGSKTINVPTFQMTEQQFEDETIVGEESKEPSISSYEEALPVEAPPASADGKGYDFSAHRKSFSGLLQATLPSTMTIVQGVKRVNSANSLSIPGAGKDSAGGASKSLPPSPQHTPRKQSLVSSSNPFERCPILLEHCDVTNAESVAAVVEPLLQHPLQEDLMIIAKDTAKGLYADLPGPERLDKIGAMVSKLRRALDSETSHGSGGRSAGGRGGAALTDAERTKQAFLQGKRDAGVQALSALMLHYCAAMQHAQEQTDREREQPEVAIAADQ